MEKTFQSTTESRQMQKIEHLIKKICKLKYFNLEQFQEPSGKLQHA